MTQTAITSFTRAANPGNADFTDISNIRPALVLTTQTGKTFQVRGISHRPDAGVRHGLVEYSLDGHKQPEYLGVGPYDHSTFGYNAGLSDADWKTLASYVASVIDEDKAYAAHAAYDARLNKPVVLAL